MRETVVHRQRRRRREHDDFLRRIVSENLLRKSGYFPQLGRNGELKVWRELIFGYAGICSGRNTTLSGDIMYSEPDLVCYAPVAEPQLLIVEAKLSYSPNTVRSLMEQLERDRTYILDNPEKLEAFLMSQGLSDEEISRLDIGFSGVIQTRRGLRQEMYFGLLD